MGWPPTVATLALRGHSSRNLLKTTVILGLAFRIALPSISYTRPFPITKITMASSTLKPSHGDIPLYYRSFFLFVEPCSTIIGAYYSCLQQQAYLDLTHAPSAPIGGIPLSTQIVLLQLSNLYFLFALNEALVLRSTADLRVWRTLLFGLLIADFGHLYSVRALGSEIYWNVAKWNAIDWGNIGFVYAGALTRISFLLRVGFSGQDQPRRKAPRRRR